MPHTFTELLIVRYRMIELRDYQVEIVREAIDRLNKYNIAYIAAEMRVGKTLSALTIAREIGANNVLFVTKLNAKPSIEADYKKGGFKYNLTLINYESLHKLQQNDYDLIIVDEAHKLKAYPKPSERTKRLKEIVKSSKLILMSGTPNPESYSELYHQFWISKHTPFEEGNFYKWARNYVDVKMVHISAVSRVADYSNARVEQVMSILNKYFVIKSQSEAGFIHSEVEEHIIPISPNPKIYKLIKLLRRDKLYKFQDGDMLICDTAIKLRSKFHQICSGTVITENNDYRVLDDSKLQFIKTHYQNRRIAIFYKYISEGNLLKQNFDWTDNTDEFRSSDKVFISQIQSGSEGVDLSTADYLIFYNIDDAAQSYLQAKARVQARDRETMPTIHWLFTNHGIEKKIYDRVQKKKDYNNYYFRRDLDGIGV